MNREYHQTRAEADRNGWMVIVALLTACLVFWAYAIHGFLDVWGAQIHKIFSGVWQ